MNKQIIIDGCDVSGCECYSEHREGYCGWFTPCEGDSCQYKLDWALQQLKRKEQECEELKEKYLKLKEQNGSNIVQLNTANEQLSQLKAENERLKKEIGLYDCIDKWGTEQCRCACRCLGNDFCNDTDKKINKLKQTLTEIKEIANNTYLKYHTKTEYDAVIRLILQKCEVLDVR